MTNNPNLKLQDWEKISIKRKSQLIIPKELKLPHDIISTIHPNSTQSVINVPKKCGFLSREEIEITETPANILVKGLRESKWKSCEVVIAFYKRAIIAHQLTNCLTDIFLEEALELAKIADEYLATKGEPIGPLHGLPISLKDAFNLKGHDTTYGYISWCGNISPEDGICVTLIKNQGAIPFCKTNVSQGLLLVESNNNIFGKVLNPHNLSLTASGSSGGEGALVALKGSPLGICTDGGGSIRLPAHSNSVYGYMATTRRITNKGIGKIGPRGLPWVEAQIGPVANDIEILETWVKGMIDQDMSRYDYKCCPPYWRKFESYNKKLKIGFLYEDNVCDLTPPMKRGLDLVWKKMQDKFDLIKVDIGNLHREITECVFKMYSSDGGQEYKKNIKLSGEPMINRVCGSAFIQKPTPEQKDANILLADTLCSKYLDFFQDNKLDVLVTAASHNPPAPHGQYSTTSLSAVYNCLGYPAGIIPVSKVDLNLDMPTKEYSDGKIIPDLNVVSIFPYDKYDGYIKKELYTDSRKFKNAPICIQVVAKKYEDEKLLHIMKLIDQILKA